VDQTEKAEDGAAQKAPKTLEDYEISVATACALLPESRKGLVPMLRPAYLDRPPRERIRDREKALEYALAHATPLPTSKFTLDYHVPEKFQRLGSDRVVRAAERRAVKKRELAQVRPIRPLASPEVLSAATETVEQRMGSPFRSKSAEELRAGVAEFMGGAESIADGWRQRIEARLAAVERVPEEERQRANERRTNSRRQARVAAALRLAQRSFELSESVLASNVDLSEDEAESSTTARLIFNAFDSDGDDQLNRDEFAALLKAGQPDSESFDEAEVDSRLEKYFGKDGTEAISFSEFEKVLYGHSNRARVKAPRIAAEKEAARQERYAILAKDAKRVGSPHREKLESKRKEESEARQREAAAKRQREGAKRMLVLQRLVSGNRRKLTRAPQK
jgi:hypothetical protein